MSSVSVVYFQPVSVFRILVLTMKPVPEMKVLEFKIALGVCIKRHSRKKIIPEFAEMVLVLKFLEFLYEVEMSYPASRTLFVS